MSILANTKYIFKYMAEERSLGEIFDMVRKELNKDIVIAKIKGTSKLHEKGTREVGVT